MENHIQDKMVADPLKRFPTIGCCGLDCGLCPRYYTEGSSRCPGCCGPDFFKKNPGCGYITCCVNKRNLEVCGQCTEFPCSRIVKLLAKGVYDSFLTHQKIRSNLNFIREKGLGEFIDQQEKRIKLLNKMLAEFNEGRSKSFCCLSSTLLSIKGIEESIKISRTMIEKLGIQKDDFKIRAKILRKNLQKEAEKEKVELKLTKPPRWK